MRGVHGAREEGRERERGEESSGSNEEEEEEISQVKKKAERPNVREPPASGGPGRNMGCSKLELVEGKGRVDEQGRVSERGRKS